MKPPTGLPRSLRLSRAAVFLGFLMTATAFCASGCVDMKAKAVISADGSGRLDVDYRVPRALASMERYRGTEGGLPFPLEKDVLDRKALTIPGVTLSRWSRQDLEDEIRISAELRFPSLPALVQFLDSWGNRVQYEAANGQRELRFSLASGILPTQDASAWVDMAYAEYSVDLSLTLPSRALSVSPPGTLSGSRNIALFSSSTADLLKSMEPLVWTIRW